MIRQKTALLWFAWSLILLLDVPLGLACACGPHSTVLQSFELSDLVVVARAVSVEKASSTSRALYGVESTTMVVKKVYKGNIVKGEKIVFVQGGGADCIYTFKEENIGDEYLFYLTSPHGNPPRYYASTCDRSKEVRWAGDDLLYLDNLDKARGKTRISGTLSTWREENPGLAGRKIKILQNDRVWQITTNENGVYEIFDLPAGEYLVEPEIPSGWKIDNFYIQRYSASFSGNRGDARKAPMKRIPVLLESGKHAGLDIVFDIDNAIRGQILSPEGKPMKGVCLHAVRSGDDVRGIWLDCTNDDGRYEINELPSGKYLLVVNENGQITADEPFERLYYPGVSDEEKASELALRAGTFLEDINMLVPKIKEQIEISGRLLYSDGKPIADKYVFVEFKPDAKPGIISAKVSKLFKDEKFRLHILKGFEGILYAAINAYGRDYKDCSALVKIIQENGIQIMQVRSNEVRISGTEDVSDIQLSFPDCEK